MFQTFKPCFWFIANLWDVFPVTFVNFVNFAFVLIGIVFIVKLLIK